jgi:hypothetical protein
VLEGYYARRGEERREDVLIRGSWPPFLLRFWRFAVDEKGEDCVGARWRHCDMRFVRLMGRQTGRKAERFIVGCGGAQLVGDV